MKYTCKCVFLVVACISLFCGCAISSMPHQSSVSDSEGSSSLQDDDVHQGCLSEKETQEIFNYIDNVKFKSRLHLSDISYPYVKEEVICLADIGIRGVPCLIQRSIQNEKIKSDKIEEFAYGWELSRLQSYTVTVILRSEFYAIPNGNDTVFPSKHYDVLYSYVTDFFPSDEFAAMSDSERFEAYCKFGILSVPYVLKEIENGRNEFEQFFTSIGLHLSLEKYSEYMNDPELPIPERQNDKSFMQGAEDFDYKLWLEENEQDINNLFEYLDAYCAEYEANK